MARIVIGFLFDLCVLVCYVRSRGHRVLGFTFTLTFSVVAIMRD